MVSNQITAEQARTELALKNAYAAVRDRISRGERDASVWNLTPAAIEQLRKDGYGVIYTCGNNHVLKF